MNRDEKLKEAAAAFNEAATGGEIEIDRHAVICTMVEFAKSEAARQYHNEWIAVSERLPEPNERFDAWHCNGYRMASQFFSDASEPEIKDVMHRCGYTHWKPEPLPPAPKD